MQLITLASGSSGNCLLVMDGDTRVLVDAGISAKRIKAALLRMSLTPDALTAICITHEHTDHICGLRVLSKYHNIPIYASRGTGGALLTRLPLHNRLNTFLPGERLQLGGLEVQTIPTLHDASDSVGYTFTSLAGRKASVVTDLGAVTDEVAQGVCGSHLLVVETNHDPDLLEQGRYPYYLKARITGQYGHLSNSAGAALAAEAARHGAHTLVLAHLSAENNTPDLAVRAVTCALQTAGAAAALEVAPRGEPGRLYEV